MKRGEPLKRTTPLRADPDKVLEFRRRGQRSSTRKPRTFTPASPAQRLAVMDKRCVECGAIPVDPAHLTPRAQGGCDDPACVISLCRVHHRAFDDGKLDLARVLALPEFAAERSHMAGHMDFVSCLRRLTGTTVHWGDAA